MKIIHSVVLVSSLALTSCASYFKMIDDMNEWTDNKMAASYAAGEHDWQGNWSLCQDEKYLRENRFMKSYNEVVKVIQRKGIDCNNLYANEDKAETPEEREKRINNAIMMLNMAAQMGGAQNWGQPQTSKTQSGVTCFKSREWISGMNKNCVYSCLGSDAVETISSANICPLTITR